MTYVEQKMDIRNAPDDTDTVVAHCIAADLNWGSGVAPIINREMFDIKSRARIKLEQHLLGNMNMYCGERIAVISVTEELRQNIGVLEEEFDGVAGLPLQIQGVEVAVTIKEKKPGEYKVSMRSAGKVNVSAVCKEFGGGGHICASGCLVKASLEDAEKQLVAAVEKAMGE
jgi:phosphoesterase RecJ-like protein